MNRCFTVLLVVSTCVLGLIARSSHATNSVTVSSVEATANQVDLAVPVFLRNDFTVRNVVCPLMVRKYSPAYPVALKLDNRERLLTALNDIVFKNHYDNGTTDTAVCKRFPSEPGTGPGGFWGQYSYNGPEKQDVHGIPYGIMFQNGRLFGSDLTAGKDLVGSYVITLDLNDQEALLF